MLNHSSVNKGKAKANSRLILWSALEAVKKTGYVMSRNSSAIVFNAANKGRIIELSGDYYLAVPAAVLYCIAQQVDKNSL